MMQAATVSEEFATLSMDGRTERDEWFALACHRLAEIDNLAAGWDGYGSDRISKPTMNFAAMLLANVWEEARSLPFPAISPMSNGAIMIEWRSPISEVTVEVNNPNDVDVLVETLATGHTNEFHVTSNFAKLSEALEQSTKPVVAVA